MSDVQEELPEWMLKLENKRKKPHRLAHEIGAGSPCFVCGDNCPGLDLHFWRKLCRNCKCKKEDHDVKDDNEYGQFEILLGSGSRKKGGVLKMKIPKDAQNPSLPPENSSKGIQFDWLPPNVSEEVAAEYMQQLPTSKLPISGSDGALYRRQQLTKQVPLHDIDAKHCDNLTPEEADELIKYLDNLKSSVFGQACVGKVPALYAEMRTPVTGVGTLHNLPVGAALVSSQSAERLRPLPPLPPVLGTGPRPYQPQSSTPSSAYGSDEDLPPPLPTSLPPRSDLRMPSDFLPPWTLGRLAEGVQQLGLRQQEAPSSNVREKVLEDNCSSAYNPRQLPQFSSDLPLKSAPWSCGGGKELAQPKANAEAEVHLRAQMPTAVGVIASEKCSDGLGHLPADSIQVSSFWPGSTINSEAVNASIGPQMSQPLKGCAPDALGVPRAHDALLPVQLQSAVCVSEAVGGVRSMAEPLPAGPVGGAKPGGTQLYPMGDTGQASSHPSYLSPNDSSSKSTLLNYGQPAFNQEFLAASLPVDGVKLSSVLPHSIEESSSIKTDALPKSAQVMQQPLTADKNASMAAAMAAALAGAAAPLPAQTPGGSAAQGLECQECGGHMGAGEVAVFAERAPNTAWHPQCFVCSTCKELLVDLMYFYHKGTVYCGRHYAELLGIPRCFACDELIFMKEHTVAEGKAFHVKHFCCFECDVPLAGQQYIPVADQPVCLGCYDAKHGHRCLTCRGSISAGDQRVGWKHLNWHVQGDCFRCFECSKSLLGGRFTVKEDRPFCSRECLQAALQKMAGAA